MTYFLVDDEFPFHPKAIAAGNAALGLWTRAGAWSKKYVTGGYVPRDIATSLGTKTEADRLVKAGLWVRVTDGYRFHDWQDLPGNLDADGEKTRRDASREKARDRQRRKRGRPTTDEPSHATRHADSHAVTPAVTGHDVTQPVTPPVTGMSRNPSVHRPINKTSSVRPVPNRASNDGRTDELDAAPVIIAALAGLGVTNPAKIIAAIDQRCGRTPDATALVRIVTTILDRAGKPVRSPMGVVLKAIENDWSEWQQLIDEADAA